MAFIKCNINNNKELQERILWINNDPTSNFSTQTVTLLQDIDNFDFIVIYWNVSRYVDNTISIYFTPTDLKKSTDGTTGNSNITFGSRYDGSTSFSRQLFYKTNTTIKIGSAYNMGKSDPESYSAYVISTSIRGYNIPTTIWISIYRILFITKKRQPLWLSLNIFNILHHKFLLVYNNH